MRGKNNAHYISIYLIICILGIEEPPRPTAYLGGYIIDLAGYAWSPMYVLLYYGDKLKSKDF